MRRTSTLRLQRGVALLEALIAMLLFSFGILGIVAIQAKATQFSGDSEDRTRAAMLANELASQMWAQQTVSLDSTAISAWQARVTDAGSGLPSAVATSSVANGVATVKITWKAPWRKSAEQDNQYITKVQIP